MEDNVHTNSITIQNLSKLSILKHFIVFNNQYVSSPLCPFPSQRLLPATLESHFESMIVKLEVVSKIRT